MQYREFSRRKDIVIKSTLNIPLAGEQIIKITSFMVQCLLEDDGFEMEQQKQQPKSELFNMQFIQNLESHDTDALQVSFTNIQQQLQMETKIENIENFITKINAVYVFEYKHHILALIFLNKTKLCQQLELNQNNWQSLTTLSFILAIEFWDNVSIEKITNSESFLNSEISKYYNHEMLTKLRIEFLKLLGIQGVMIKQQLFFKFRHEFLSLVDANSFQTQKQIPLQEFQERAELFFETAKKLFE